MTIKFRCHICQKLLRTSDEKAGRMAKCPNCGEKVTVPMPKPAKKAAQEYEDYEAYDEDDGQYEEYETYDDAGGYGSRTMTPLQPCPLCGELNDEAATTCLSCGEPIGYGGFRSLRSGRRGAPIPLSVGDVLSTSWKVYHHQMGVCIGAPIVMFGVGVVVRFIFTFMLLVLGTVIALLSGREVGPILFVVTYFGLNIGGIFLDFVVRAYLKSGHTRILLKVARGKSASVGDLFSTGYLFLRMLVNTFIFLVAVVLGALLGVVPGVIAALILWPYPFVLVDRDSPGIDCLMHAANITRGTWLQISLISLAALGMNLLGLLLCGVGLLFTLPLTRLYFAVAYCRMTGQRTIA